MTVDIVQCWQDWASEEAGALRGLAAALQRATRRALNAKHHASMKVYRYVYVLLSYEVCSSVGSWTLQVYVLSWPGVCNAIQHQLQL